MAVVFTVTVAVAVPLTIPMTVAAFAVVAATVVRSFWFWLCSRCGRDRFHGPWPGSLDALWTATGRASRILAHWPGAVARGAMGSWRHVPSF